MEKNCLKTYDVMTFQCKANNTVEKTSGIVLSQFKRPYLEKQLMSIRNSSINCREIIIVQGGLHKNNGSSKDGPLSIMCG